MAIKAGLRILQPRSEVIEFLNCCSVHVEVGPRLFTKRCDEIHCFRVCLSFAFHMFFAVFHMFLAGHCDQGRRQQDCKGGFDVQISWRAGAELCGPCRRGFVADAALCGPWSAAFVAGAAIWWPWSAAFVAGAEFCGSWSAGFVAGKQFGYLEVQIS